MPGEEIIRARLEVDLSGSQQLSAQAQRQAQQTTAALGQVEQRIRRSRLEVDQLRSSVDTLDARLGARLQTRFKGVGKSAAAAGGAFVISEAFESINIPVDVQPFANIGAATAAGAAFGGPAGALIGFVLSTVSEIVKGIANIFRHLKSLDDKVEEGLRALRHAEQALDAERNKRFEEDRRTELDSRAKAREEAKELDYQALLLTETGVTLKTPLLQ